MALTQRISDDMKAAMRAGDKPRLGAIRLILAAIKQREVDERIQLDDAQVLEVLGRMLKQRRDSLNQFEAAGREDLAAQERFEIEVVQGYLPAALGDAEVDALLAEALAETGASSPREMGAVMAWLKPRIAGRADMAALSKKVRAALGA